MENTPVPIFAAVIGALSALLVLFLKEKIERSKSKRLAALLLLWIAKSLRRSIASDVAAASYIDLGIVNGCAADIASTQLLVDAFDSIQTAYSAWKSLAFQYKDIDDQSVSATVKALDQTISELVRFSK